MLLGRRPSSAPWADADRTVTLPAPTGPPACPAHGQWMARALIASACLNSSPAPEHDTSRWSRCRALCRCSNARVARTRVWGGCPEGALRGVSVPKVVEPHRRKAPDLGLGTAPTSVASRVHESGSTPLSRGVPRWTGAPRKLSLAGNLAPLGWIIPLWARESLARHSFLRRRPPQTGCERPSVDERSQGGPSRF